MPIPEDAAAEGEEIERAVQKSLAEAGAEGVRGNDVTPFLLERIRQLTGGRSLEANVRLIKNNAAVGAQIAGRLSSSSLALLRRAP